jgi:hypothetical protein
MNECFCFECCHAGAADAKLSNSFVLIAAVADAKLVNRE